ncbi:hypothetical protein [Gaiella sp.]|uniref:hypothetical protein n=1 Tax=Gaiella sp. TaxID=2663207 RepID=UPI003266104A
MSAHTARFVAWSLFGLGLAFALTAYVLWVATGAKPQGAAFAGVAFLTFSIVGAMVASGRPRNPVGWLLLAIGGTAALGQLTSTLYHWDLRHPGSSGGTALVALVDGTLWLLWIGFLIPRVVLLFPDGKLPSPRWRVVSVAQYGVLAALVFTRLEPGPISDYEAYDNPLGIGVVGDLVRSASHVAPLMGLVFGVALLAPVAAVIVRFRRSNGIERLQMKWFTWAVGVTSALWIVPGIPGVPSLAGLDVLPMIAMCLAPVTIGIAILRYRLYEIDRLISRTLVYGALTVVLGGLYVGLVLVGQAVFSSFAGGSDLAIAASTLVVAALFLPVRARVQHFVDQRFYRRRYDEQRTLEDFGARLREQVDLETLDTDLRAAIDETMQPAHVSVWLRMGVGGR